MKLLLVDDDAKLAASVRRGLTAEGFTVEVAADGIEGLWRASEGTYDLIVLDILLPGRNGYEVCRELRRAENWTPILMLTAKDGSLDEAEALDTGADDYLTKPFSFAVLVAHIRALLRRTRGGSPAPVSVGDLRLDPGPAPGVAWQHRGVAHGARIRGARVPGPPPRRRCCPSRRSSTACGTSVSTATPTSSRCTCGGCGASSTCRTATTTIDTLRGAGYRVVDQA